MFLPCIFTVISPPTRTKRPRPRMGEAQCAPSLHIAANQRSPRTAPSKVVDSVACFRWLVASVRRLISKADDLARAMSVKQVFQASNASGDLSPPAEEVSMDWDGA